MSTALQFVGALLVLAAFALTQRRTIAVDSIRALVLNAAGAGILAVLALADSQWGFLALEGTWALVSVVGLITRLRPMAGPVAAPVAAPAPNGSAVAEVQDRSEMLGRLHPDRRPGSFVFVAVTGPPAPTLHPVMTFTQDEGRTLILTRHEADDARLPYELVLAWIRLTVHGARDGVGLTAAVSGALADAGLGCKVVATAFHDHLFVPVGSADDAIRVLTELSARHRRAAEQQAAGAASE